MKIAQVNLQKAWGGAEQHLLLLSRSLREAGHSVVVCCHPRGRLLQEAGAHGLLTLPLTSLNQLDPTVGIKLAACLARIRPDILHVHTPRDYIGGLLASRLLPGVRLALTRHMMLPLKPMMRGLYARTDGVCCLSAGMRRFLVTQGVPPSLLYRVRSGIDTSAFGTDAAQACRERLRHEWGLPPGMVAIGLVGRLVAGKGHALLLQALAAIRHTQIAAPPIQLVFIGEGPERETLAQQAQALDLSDAVHFAGFRTDIPATLAALDIFTLPSSSELLPLSVMEAMAAGLPVIATDVGSLSELIEPEVSGLLTPPDSVEPLQEALLRLAAAPALRRGMGHRAHTRAHRNFTLEAMATDTLEMYHRMIAGTGPVQN